MDGQAVYFIILRWIHLFAGITWIGLLYYFNFVQTPSFKKLDAATKNAVIPELVKRALFWFRWGAVVTVAAGWIYFLSAWGIGNFYDVTSRWWSMSILAGGGLGTFMLLNVWGIIWRNQKKIIKGTEDVVKGKDAPAEMGRWGKQTLIASRMNVAMSLPMLFFMASASHLDLLG